MSSIKDLEPPEYTAEERKSLIDFLLALKTAQIREFLKLVELPVSGTRIDLRERVQTALDDGEVTYEQVVGFLDSLAPWGKQHVFLYSGPRGDLAQWKDPDAVFQLLKDHRLGKLFNARLPLILPEKLTLSSITHLDGKLRITVVRKRTYSERAPEHDDEKQSVAGEPITLRAYVHHVSRMLVVFEWDLVSNDAILHITQLDRDTLYEQVAKEFFELVKAWLDIESMFGLVDIRGAIPKLHEFEGNGHPEARSHGIHYRTLQGRRVSGHSPSHLDSVLGEKGIDRAMEIVREESVGHLGNFYWLSNGSSGPVSNPLQGDVHVILVADKSRINFPTPNTEDVLRYVLHRVRQLS